MLPANQKRPAAKRVAAGRFRPSKKLAFGDLFRRRMHRLPTRLTARRAANGVRKALLRKASEADAHVV
ncbi:MAG: hypothetical protein IKU70_11170, partial [Clostridia bacterium]|nr:hypothetical protein [Clostridia bacterium]